MPKLSYMLMGAGTFVALRAASFAAAQAPEMVRIRATIESVKARFSMSKAAMARR